MATVPPELMLRSIHIDVVAGTIVFENEDRTTVSFTIQRDSRQEASPPPQPEQAPVPAPAAPKPQTVTVTGRIKSEPRNGRPDGQGNATTWCKLAAHSDDRDGAHMLSCTFHRHTAKIALQFEEGDQVTVSGYLRESDDPNRMDSFSVFALVNYPGKQ
jgi:hypothetical protein